MKSTIQNISPFASYSSQILTPKHPFTNLFTRTPNLYNSLKITNQFTNPYKR